MSETAKPDFVSGFVSIVGRPNGGKSTLLNAMVGMKVAIVADKPQTTRTAVQGVVTLPGAQIIFVDTPGIHDPDTAFNRRMLETVRSALSDRDLLVYVVDATRPFAEADREAVDLVKDSKTPTLLALNKIDRMGDKGPLLTLIEQYKTLAAFEEFIPISAMTGEGLGELRDAIVNRLPAGPAYFPEDQVTDQPERFLASELIRERILRETRQEVPHAVAVMVDHWEDKPNVTRIVTTVFVEREGQKGIIIGAKGSMLKKIGTLARQEIEKLLGRKVFLEIHVKVQPRWREDPRFLDALDWRFMTGTEVK